MLCPELWGLCTRTGERLVSAWSMGITEDLLLLGGRLVRELGKSQRTLEERLRSRLSRETLFDLSGKIGTTGFSRTPLAPTGVKQ